MSKLINDKYYTPSEVVDLCLKIINDSLKSCMITDIIEPSAGSGAFSSKLKCTAYDIEPESEKIIKCDFLSLNIPYMKGRLCVGNPPFGVSNSLSVKFFKKCCEIGDYIAFIQPISQYNNNLQMYEFDLISSTDLGEIIFSNKIKLHCCFNVWKRPSNGKLNSKPNYKLKDIVIKEYRRNGSYEKPKDYDYAMCNWGNGSLGKIPEYVGQYAQEVYFYCNKKEYLQQMKELLSFENIREYVKSISSKKISVMRLYKYLKDNIEGIE